MNPFKLLSIAAPIIIFASQTACAQGTLVFDQQSTDGSTFFEGGVLYGQHPVQSFVPTLDSLGFVTLYLMVDDVRNATINLRAQSATGPILGSTLPISRSAFTGQATFYFETPVALVPGTTYFLEPITQLGGGYLNASPLYNYPGGALLGGDYDLWFREGIVVPEPATGSVALLAAAVTLRSRSRRPRPHPGTP